jgi:hypothetical protein
VGNAFSGEPRELTYVTDQCSPKRTLMYSQISGK